MVSSTKAFILTSIYASVVLLPIASAQAAQRQVLHGHVPQGVATARVLQRVPRSMRLNLAIGLPLRNQDQLELLLQQISDPASPNYQQYLTPEQFTDQFGPTEADYRALIDFAESNGLVVTGTHPNRTILDVAGAAPAIEKAFHLNLMSYSHPIRGTFYAPDREPSLDFDIQTLDISGLDNFELPRPMSLDTIPLTQVTPFVTGSGPAGYFIGKDFRAAYAPGVALTGTGQAVGLLEFDGFYASDVVANFKQAALPAVPMQTVLLDGVSGTPGGSNIEVILDIMMASYMAPGLSKVMIYEGNTPNDILNRMATDNLAQQLSSSWTFSPINATTEQIFKQYIVQGQSFFQASGDSGAYKGAIGTPADDPNVTVVGGTSLTTSGAGGPWQSESTWAGSGGGISTSYPIPSYQQGLSMVANGGSATMRNIPDVALTAAVQMFLIQSNGQAVAVGGTSAAAPLWAGYIALANQQAAANKRSRVGFLNPLIYAIGKGLNHATDLHDIVLGNNSGFPAISGYDLATGWGTPAGQHLIDDLTAAGQPAFTLSASQATLSIKPGSSGASAITVGPQNGFSGSVTLTASGLPSGVTASFSPASTTGASTLTLTASASAVTGTSTVTVTGTSGALTSTATIALTIATPNFTLAASPASLTVKPGSNGASTITVGPVNGFSGSVTLTASGLPSGVTASFGPASTTGTSTLTLAASASALTGISTVTVTGTSGALKSTATIALTIAMPSFTLAASPSALVILQGSSGGSTITVGPVSGFSGSVSLAASSLASGVTASFSPASTTGASTLTLTASASAVTGTSTVTVTGVSGTLKSTAMIALTIAAPPNFTLSVSPASLSVAQGSSGASTITGNALNGFNGTVSVAASGMPSGVTAAFSAGSAPGTVLVTLAASSSAAMATSTVTITGTSGTLIRTTTIGLTVVAAAVAAPVNMASVFNINAMVTDASKFTGSGLDGGLNGQVTAYSANLLGAQQTVSGTTFSFGPANVANAASGKTVPLPSGQYSTLKMLATAVNGNQASQNFIVTYTDGTSSLFQQSLSDWFTPQSYVGESKALTMAYRDTSTGLRDNRTFLLYGYSLTLNPSKKVSSITLPNNRNVVVVAMTLTK